MVTNDSDDTAAKASIGDVSGYADSVDAQVRTVLGRVLAQQPPSSRSGTRPRAWRRSMPGAPGTWRTA